MKMDEPVATGDAVAKARDPLPRWKAMLFIVAGLLVVVGAISSFVGGGESSLQSAAPGGNVPVGAAGLTGNQSGSPSATPEEQPAESSAWSGGMLKMGFSFFVAFAVGYLMRVFVRVSLIVIGSIVLLLTWFSYLGFVTVNWAEMETVFDAFVDRIGTDFENFRTMLTGSLPQAGLGGLGLVAGFKKR